MHRNPITEHQDLTINKQVEDQVELGFDQVLRRTGCPDDLAMGFVTDVTSSIGLLDRYQLELRVP